MKFITEKLELKKIHIVILGLVAVLITAARTPQQDCLQEVRAIFDKMNTAPPLGQNNYYFSFNIKSTLRKAPSNASKTSTSDVELHVGATQSRYISKEALMYIDQENTFTVIPSKKMIYWTAVNQKEGKEERAQKLTMMQDKLFDMSTVGECMVVSPKDGYNKMITLIPNQKAKDYYQVDKITFYIDSKEKAMKKIILSYSSANKLESVELTYHKIDYYNKSQDLGKPVKPLFITTKGDLTPAYTEYKLVDTRNNK